MEKPLQGGVACLLLYALLTRAVSGASGSAARLSSVRELHSNDGALAVDLILADWAKPGSGLSPLPVVFCGGSVSVVAPTLRLQPGDKVNIRIQSRLPGSAAQGRGAIDDVAGMGVLGVRLADAGLESVPLQDPRMAVHTFTVSSDHAPGLFWYRVGRASLHLVGALYVMPATIEQEEPPRLLMLQYQGPSAPLPGTSGGSGEGYLVNGQRHPELDLVTGKPVVLDVAHSGGPHLLEIQLQHRAPRAMCAMHVLQLDGIDLSQPRRADMVPLGPLQRARLAVTCQATGEADLVSWPAFSRAAIADSPSRWTQRILQLKVTKPQATEGSSSDPSLRMLSAKEEVADLTEWKGPMTTWAVGAPVCTPHHCSADVQRASLLTSRAIGGPPDVHEVTISQSIAGTCGALHLEPAGPFQIMEYIPSQPTSAAQNQYLRWWGPIGDWRDVLPPVPGTFRIRFKSAAIFIGVRRLAVDQRRNAAVMSGTWFPRFSGTSKRVNRMLNETDDETRAVTILIEVDYANGSNSTTNPAVVTHAILDLLRDYTVTKQNLPIGKYMLAAQQEQDRSLDTASAEACSNPASPPVATSLVLTLRNDSCVPKVVELLQSLLGGVKHPPLPVLCNIDITTQTHNTAAAVGQTVQSVGAGGGRGTSQAIILLSFCAVAMTLVAVLLLYRRLAPTTWVGGTRRCSLPHDPTTIETQITDLADMGPSAYASSSSALSRHTHTRSRSGTLLNTGMALNPVCMPPRLPQQQPTTPTRQAQSQSDPTHTELQHGLSHKRSSSNVGGGRPVIRPLRSASLSDLSMFPPTGGGGGGGDPSASLSSSGSGPRDVSRRRVT